MKQLQKENDYLKHHLENSDVLSQQQVDKIATLEQHLKESQLVSPTSSFSRLTTKEFKQLAYRVHDEFYQSMANLYVGFNEMQELYNSFKRQSNVLQDHHTCRRAASKAFNNILD